jgi:hypothetical protein
MPKMLDAALSWIRDDVPVFPCRTDDKAPLTPNGFKDASLDAGQVKLWWTQYPSAMIGMPTGKASKRWVLDVDVDPGKGIDGPKELARLVAKHGPLPKTLTCTTPRGGAHYYFTWTGVPKITNSSGALPLGLQVRGEGGYTIVPPSVRADGTPYVWSNGTDPLASPPTWLTDLITSSPRTRKWAKNALEKECAAVAQARPGERNNTLNTAAFNLGQIIGGGGLDEDAVRDALFAAAEACKLVEDDGTDKARATIDSGIGAGIKQPRYRSGNGAQAALGLGAPSSAGSAPPPPPPSLPPAPTVAPSGAPGGPIPISTPTSAPTRPIIRLIDGELPRIVDEAEEILCATGNCHIYQRGDLLVRPIQLRLQAAGNRNAFSWQLAPVTKPFLVDTLTKLARFEKMNYKLGGYVPKDCPDYVAEVYLSRAGHWKIPVLLGVVNTPFLRSDGSLCERPGYDQPSALLFHPEGQSFPSIAAKPTLESAREALKYLEATLLAEFPFVGNIDRAVALSAILTAFDRRAMPTAPMHAFSSPMPGTGKSLLVDLASVLTTGHTAAVTSQGEDDGELEKRLAAALIASNQIISIDNCDRELGGSFLCKALTQRDVEIRLLGYSRSIKVPVHSVFFANGNNLEITRDIIRRVLFCQMDAGIEEPELRDFNSDVLEVAYDQRDKLVAAILTILRAWHSAPTAVGVKPLGSYKQWSDRIRSPLIWLDREDPVASRKHAREADPEREVTSTIYLQWKQNFGTTNTLTVQQIIARAMVNPELYGAFEAVAWSQGSGLSNRRLGRWLNKNKGRVINGLQLTKAGFGQGGYPLWRLVIV